MMDSLQIFFHPLSQFSVPDKGLALQIKPHDVAFPDTETAAIALIFVPEYRGERSGEESLHSEASLDISLNAIRKYLYGFSALSGRPAIVDMGNLRIGDTLTDTYQRLREVCQCLIQQNTLPVIIGGSHDLDYAQFWAYQDTGKIIHLLAVDAKIDLTDEDIPTNKHLYDILSHHPNFLFEYAHIGYQRHLTDFDAVQILDNLNFEVKSVGDFRNNLTEIEPLLRAADMLSFDLNAIRKAEMPLSAYPFGLTGEEACLISRYAGLNEKLTSIGFYGYKPLADTDETGAQVLATMIWYFLEGFCHRTAEYSFMSNFHIKYNVTVPALRQDIVFYKSKLSEKWWMEVGLANKQTPFQRNMVIPCSYNDYQIAVQGKVPDRWLKALDKLV
jgi:formiminoglutamase